MKKFRKSDWLRAVQLTPKWCNFVLLQCKLPLLSVQICVITFWWGKKTFTGKTNMAAKALRRTKL